MTERLRKAISAFYGHATAIHDSTDPEDVRALELLRKARNELSSTYGTRHPAVRRLTRDLVRALDAAGLTEEAARERSTLTN